MKILVMGDFHGKFPVKLKKLAKEVDFILCTGDFGGSDDLLKIIFQYLGKKPWYKVLNKNEVKKYVLEDYNSGIKIIKELDKIGKPIYIISGNWDFVNKKHYERYGPLNLINYSDLIRKLENLYFWKRGFKKIKNLKILAFGGNVTPGSHVEKVIFSKKKHLKYIKENKKEIDQLMKYEIKDLDILFTHYSPFGFFDKVKFKGYNPMNGKHVGFKGYTDYIKKFQPNICISGHMHEYQGMKKLGKTKIIATGAAKDGKAVILNIDEKNKEKIKVQFIK